MRTLSHSPNWDLMSISFIRVRDLIHNIGDYLMLNIRKPFTSKPQLTRIQREAAADILETSYNTIPPEISIQMRMAVRLKTRVDREVVDFIVSNDPKQRITQPHRSTIWRS